MEEVSAFITKYAYEQYVQRMGISIRAKVCNSSFKWGTKLKFYF